MKIRQVAVRIDLISPFSRDEWLCWVLIDDKYLHQYLSFDEMRDTLSRYDSGSIKRTTTFEKRADQGVHIVDNRLARIFYDITEVL